MAHQPSTSCAFVEKVYDDGSFLVSETNYGGNPNYTFRKKSLKQIAPLVLPIRRNRRVYT